jgi:hypothetical protein
VFLVEKGNLSNDPQWKKEWMEKNKNKKFNICPLLSMDPEMPSGVDVLL